MDKQVNIRPFHAKYQKKGANHEKKAVVMDKWTNWAILAHFRASENFAKTYVSSTSRKI